MLNKKGLSLFLVCVVGISILFIGCQNSEDQKPGKEVGNIEVEQPEEKESQEVEDLIELGDWNGTWNNMGAYLEDEELQEAFTELGEREDLTPEKAKQAYVEKRKCEFDGLIVDEDKLIFLDGFKDKNGKTIKEAKYKYKETCVVKHGNFDTEWFAFEAEGNEGYEIVLMMPVHGEEALTHFHMRYGDDLEELLAMDSWYPTFVKPNSTYDQLYEEVLD